MDPTAVIKDEADRLAAVLAATDPRREVPTCPGWTAVDLLWHLTEVHEFWHEVLSSGAMTDEEVGAIEEAKEPRPEDVQRIAARRTAATKNLVEELGRREDTEAAWFWGADHTVGSTRRMQVQEATIHRVDAELTAGQQVTTPSEQVSTAGIDHCIDVMMAEVYAWVPDSAEVERVALAEIGEGRILEISHWWGEGENGADEEFLLGRRLPADADAAELPRAQVTGSVAALNLWLWGRAEALPILSTGAEEISIDGDDEAVAALGRLIEQGLQ
ncbi:maleylpyruvate isomerase N-terminal domain-containing protein [Parenemella sanctibonifatiensis]|uniref:Mycothiol-dependent maleylpyruvate isomerase metal-binding domain-containing protein n=1 Tax=Parenemella sanctibonifatiensis TaxID=2016505 RepID=A0A255EM81_9ACTN|nr:maleylpyruvate isomerase N-terminal domain-containing protein [Parenemella sanctibonifatiensis]OYN92320.1 hypothetical protein CGZ91_02095 [Parenemella sanctibonifatiensis]